MWFMNFVGVSRLLQNSENLNFVNFYLIQGSMYNIVYLTDMIFKAGFAVLWILHGGWSGRRVVGR